MRRIVASTFIVVLAACGHNNGATGPGTVPIPPAPSGLGVFAVTFSADVAACSDLPEQARSRTYAAALFPGGSIAVLTGAKFVPASAPYSSWNVLYTKFVNKTADIWFQDPPIWEALSDEGYLVIYGDAHGEMNADSVTLPFAGRFEYCPEREQDTYPECEVPATTCESKNHQLTLRLK